MVAFLFGFLREIPDRVHQAESLAAFLQKLRDKKQTEMQQQQASYAVSLYYDLIHVNVPSFYPSATALGEVYTAEAEIAMQYVNRSPPQSVPAPVTLKNPNEENAQSGHRRVPSPPLPVALLSELKSQLAAVKNLHRRDLARKYAGVFLVTALEKKYPRAVKEFVWQSLFPARDLTRVPESGEYRRYHLHETQVQKAIKEAVGKTSLCKGASAHSFRHSYASHLLQANIDTDDSGVAGP